MDKTILINKEVIKDGKKPISQRKLSKEDLAEFSSEGNALSIPSQLRKYAEEQGIKFRWLSSEVMHEKGAHPRGWHIFYLNDHGINLGNRFFKNGSGPDNVVRSGTLVLGYKPIEAVLEHQRLLRDRTARQSGDYQKQKAQELRSRLKYEGVNARVLEGYEENEI